MISQTGIGILIEQIPTSQEMVEIVNIVATGDLGRKFDLHMLSTQIHDLETQYEPEVFPGLQIRTATANAVMTVFSSGKYTITGVTSESELESVFTEVSTSIKEYGIAEYEGEGARQPDIQNFVCKSNLERELDLASVAVGLGVNNTEYNPEKSAFVYYRPQEIDCLITISSNGRISITGVRNIKTAERAFDLFKRQIDELFNDEGATE